MEHELKTWPEHFEPVASGRKTVELRRNDRNYQVGDTLHLREWEPMENDYTGRSARAAITHIVSGGEWLTPGYVALSIREEQQERELITLRTDRDLLMSELGEANQAVTVMEEKTV